MSIEQAELEQQAQEREQDGNGFADAMAAFAKDEPAPPPPVTPPAPVVEGEVAKAPEPEDDASSPTDGEQESQEAAPAAIPEIEALKTKLDNLERDKERHRQQAAYWMQSFQQRAAQPEPLKQPQPEVVAAPFAEAKPRLNQFETTDAWEEAVFNWIERRQDHKADQIKREIFQQQNQIQIQRQQEEHLNAKIEYENARVAEGAKQYGKDFVNAADYLSTFVKPGSQMYESMFRLKSFPEVVIELGTNRVEAERIARLHPEEQIYELKTLEKKLVAKAELARKAQTKLPTKVEAPGGGEDLKPKPTTAKLRQAAKASGDVHDWAKVFGADTTM